MRERKLHLLLLFLVLAVLSVLAFKIVSSPDNPKATVTPNMQLEVPKEYLYREEPPISLKAGKKDPSWENAPQVGEAVSPATLGGDKVIPRDEPNDTDKEVDEEADVVERRNSLVSNRFAELDKEIARIKEKLDENRNDEEAANRLQHLLQALEEARAQLQDNLSREIEQDRTP